LGNIQEALVYLNHSIDRGFADLNHILLDEDLIPLHQTEGFKSACDRLNRKADERKAEVPVKTKTEVPVKTEDQGGHFERRTEPVPEPEKDNVERKTEPMDIFLSELPTVNVSKIVEEVNTFLSELEIPLKIEDQSGEKPDHVEKKNEPANIFKPELSILHDMGFYDDSLLIDLLKRFDGDLQRTIQSLLQ